MSKIMDREFVIQIADFIKYTNETIYRDYERFKNFDGRFKERFEGKMDWYSCNISKSIIIRGYLLELLDQDGNKVQMNNHHLNELLYHLSHLNSILVTRSMDILENGKSILNSFDESEGNREDIISFIDDLEDGFHQLQLLANIQKPLHKILKDGKE